MNNAPLRKCIGCQEMKEKRELIRIVKPKEGEIFIDPTGKANGRGAYICRSVECLQAARKKRKLERAFSSEGKTIHIDDVVYETMEKELMQDE